MCFLVASKFSISSFYGLLDLLSGTELNAGQSEIGKVKFLGITIRRSWACSPNGKAVLRTAFEGIEFPKTPPSFSPRKQIIDSILDYSKLEASGWQLNVSCLRFVYCRLAVKLEPSGFLVEVSQPDCTPAQQLRTVNRISLRLAHSLESRSLSDCSFKRTAWNCCFQWRPKSSTFPSTSNQMCLHVCFYHAYLC